MSSAPRSPTRLDLLDRNRFIHINAKHLKWADDWFARYGSATVFFSRMLPIIRTFISLPAGVARMPFRRFIVLTTLGSIPWVLALALVGESVGHNWESWRHHLAVLDYAVAAAIVAGIVYLVLKRRRAGGTGDRAAGEPT
jgi:membrane protein DedA with SNARE-associated domain